jgi:nuclease S1
MLKHSRIITLVCVVAFLAGPSTRSWAWSTDGHRIVARIAAKALTSEARQKVAAILGVANTDAAVEEAMADAALWPDQIDKGQTGTTTWHFINVAIATPFSIAGLCPSHKCVIDRIDEMQTRLRTNKKGFKLVTKPVPNRPMTSREVAFLIHFIGDIHQPLHASANGDRGGVCVPLSQEIAHGAFPTTNLHGAWDRDEVESVLAVLGDESQTAAALFQRVQNGAVVDQLTPVDWAHESYDLARTDVYQKLNIANSSLPAGTCPVGLPAVDVDQTYLDSNVADVEQQLMRAGIRLANVLNEICAGTGCKANP